MSVEMGVRPGACGVLICGPQTRIHVQTLTAFLWALGPALLPPGTSAGQAGRKLRPGPQTTGHVQQPLSVAVGFCPFTNQACVWRFCCLRCP